MYARSSLSASLTTTFALRHAHTDTLLAITATLTQSASGTPRLPLAVSASASAGPNPLAMEKAVARGTRRRTHAACYRASGPTAHLAPMIPHASGISVTRHASASLAISLTLQAALPAPRGANGPTMVSASSSAHFGELRKNASRLRATGQSKAPARSPAENYTELTSPHAKAIPTVSGIRTLLHLLYVRGLAQGALKKMFVSLVRQKTFAYGLARTARSAARLHTKQIQRPAR